MLEQYCVRRKKRAHRKEKRHPRSHMFRSEEFEVLHRHVSNRLGLAIIPVLKRHHQRRMLLSKCPHEEPVRGRGLLIFKITPVTDTDTATAIRKQDTRNNYSRLRISPCIIRHILKTVFNHETKQISPLTCGPSPPM